MKYFISRLHQGLSVSREVFQADKYYANRLECFFLFDSPPVNVNTLPTEEGLVGFAQMITHASLLCIWHHHYRFTQIGLCHVI